MSTASQPESWRRLAAALQAGARVDLSPLTQIRRYAPEDLTITVEGGLTLDALQAHLRRHGQWLPLDPPGAGSLPIAEILDRNLSGPRRHGYGTIREHLLGLRVALANGEIIRSGGEVVKNVAGYDLLKLFVGAERSLGVIVEAAFKLQPVPAAESTVTRPCASWDDTANCLEQLEPSPITPVVFDLHNLTPRTGAIATLVLVFAGSREEVAWQVNQVRALGFTENPSAGEGAWPADPARGGPLPRRHSVLPSRLLDAVRALHPAPFVARAGLGVLEFLGPSPASFSDSAPGPAASALMHELKKTFDPHGLLPPLPLAAGNGNFLKA